MVKADHRHLRQRRLRRLRLTLSRTRIPTFAFLAKRWE
jgi:hypothetical protein